MQTEKYCQKNVRNMTFHFIWPVRNAQIRYEVIEGIRHDHMVETRFSAHYIVTVLPLVPFSGEAVG